MRRQADTVGHAPQSGITLRGLRFFVFSTRNLLFLTAVLAMNFTLMRPSPVDLLYITSFLMSLIYMALFPEKEVTRRFVMLTLLLGSWAMSYFIASSGHLGEDTVNFELLAKTFAISIAIIGAFVSMTWGQRHFETFMKVYIASAVTAATLGTIGFLTQMELLTWDGRAKGLIDDPNMYGSFLIPAVVFCIYFLARGKRGKVLLSGAMAIVLLGILLSFSRIAIVATLFVVAVYVFIYNRRNPRRLLLIAGGFAFTLILLSALASLLSPEFLEKLLGRMTFAESYDLGEEGRYHRYLLVLPMILQNPIGLGVLQLEKIFPEPIHDIWLSSFVNYGWTGGISYLALAIGSVVVTLRNIQQTKNEIVIALFISLLGIIMCSSLHEGEHWRHAWLFYGLVWGFSVSNFKKSTGRNADQATITPGRNHASPPR